MEKDHFTKTVYFSVEMFKANLQEVPVFQSLEQAESIDKV